MQEKIKGYLGKVAGWWKAAGKKVKLFLIAGLIAVVAVVAVVLAMQMNQPYTTLFTGLNQTELNEIVSYLSEQGMADYRIEGSDTILVPAEQEVRLKAALAQQGYPKSGFAYSMYLDHVGSLTTEGEREQLELYELQDRIAAVVRCFDGVQEAVVDITPGEDNTFILDSENKYDASAAVFVTEQSSLKSRCRASAILSATPFRDWKLTMSPSQTLTGTPILRGIPLRISRICPR